MTVVRLFPILLLLAALAASALAGSLIVSYARARGEVLGVTCLGGLMQRVGWFLCHGQCLVG